MNWNIFFQFQKWTISSGSGEFTRICCKTGRKQKVWSRRRIEWEWKKEERWRESRRQNLINGLRNLRPWPLISPHGPSLPANICLLWLSSPYPFLFITLSLPLLWLLGVFLLRFLMLQSMVRWALFIYGHALSVCVGLSNIHLSCANIIQSLIPSHMQGMKKEHWSLLRFPSLNTPNSKGGE